MPLDRYEELNRPYQNTQTRVISYFVRILFKYLLVQAPEGSHVTMDCTEVNMPQVKIRTNQT